MTDEDRKDNLEFELSQYFDGSLSGRRARRLERRVEGDPTLQEELKKYAALDQQLAQLAGQELPGADYDWQRTEVVRRLERQRLLETRSRPFFFRPVFWTVSSGLAVAAALVVGIVMWMSTAGPSGKPPIATGGPAAAPVVSVALVMPGDSSAKPAPSEARVTLRKLDENDYKLMMPPGDNDGTEIATRSRSKPPPGTLMVTVTPSRPAKARPVSSFLFPLEF